MKKETENDCYVQTLKVF